MKFNVRIEVKPKEGLTDPEAETVRKSLVELDFRISQLGISKQYEIAIEAESKKEAEVAARVMCARLLANPVIDQYKVEVEDNVLSES